MRTEALRLPWCHLERKFQVKGWRPFALGRLLICAGLPLPGHRMEASFSTLRTFVRYYSTGWRLSSTRHARSGGPPLLQIGTAVHPPDASRGLSRSFSVI